jgi:transposase
MKRKQWPNETKFQIVVEGLRGGISIADLCNKYEVHQTQYYQWRDQFLNQGAKVFTNDQASKREEQMQKRIAKMQRVIGELTLELKKND